MHLLERGHQRDGYGFAGGYGRGFGEFRGPDGVGQGCVGRTGSGDWLGGRLSGRRSSGIRRLRRHDHEAHRPGRDEEQRAVHDGRFDREQGQDFRYGSSTRPAQEFIPDGYHWDNDESTPWIDRHPGSKPNNPNNPVGMIASGQSSGGGGTPVRGQPAGHLAFYIPPNTHDVVKSVFVADANLAMILLPAEHAFGSNCGDIAACWRGLVGIRGDCR